MNSPHGLSALHRWKGKKRDEGDGGSDGMVVSLDMVGDGVYDAVYTVPVTVGASNQKFSLQVDTGSSDLWIASTSCSSDACTSNKPQLYDPSSSNATGQSFSITYLSGQVSGPIVWDKVTVGDYEIDNQALAAASSVTDEPLASGFSGILGLALPLNSVIAQQVPPVTSNAPDGATFSSNLFGITPVEDAPSQFFYSLTLERPGSSKIPSQLGIGRHPENIAPDPSKITYSELVAEGAGTLFWKVEVKAITVYVNGTALSIAVGRGVSGGVFPEAVLDSGVPFIIATPSLASGIWGALGINPAADGNFYMPCSMPLNMTITLDDQSEIPLHPLDLSAPPQDDPSSKNCVGLVQQSTVLNSPTSVGDIILGVPFLRNVYTVMAYELPDSSGIIGNGSADMDGGSDFRNHSGRLRARVDVKPRLGLLSLTNATTALSEFNTVRVLNQPLGQAPSQSTNSGTAAASGKKVSVGLEVLFGLLGFVALCAGLFFVRWLMMRRQWARAEKQEPDRGRGPGAGVGDSKDVFAFTGYELAPRRSLSQVPTEDTQDTKKKRPFDIDESFDSGRTHVDDGGDWSDSEFGFRRKKDIEERDVAAVETVNYAGDSPTDTHFNLHPPLHQRTPSEIGDGGPGTVIPLLTHARDDSQTDDLAEFGMGAPMGMAGIGTAFRGSVIDAGLSAGVRHSSAGSVGSVSSTGSARPRPTRQPTGPRPSSGPRRASAASLSEVPAGDEIPTAL